ncbi:hypothetical protein H0H92_010010, partial [Tricholoma furcatifolium]
MQDIPTTPHHNRKKLDKKVSDYHKETRIISYPETTESITNLAVIPHHTVQLKERQELEEQVLNSRREAFHNSHPETIRAMANLATTLHSAGQLKKAQELYEEMFHAYKEAFDDSHLVTNTARANQAAHSATQLTQVQELHKKILITDKDAFDDSYSKNIAAVTNLSATPLHSVIPALTSVAIDLKPITSFLVPELAQRHAENIEPIIYKILLYSGYQGTYFLYSGFNPETVHFLVPEQEIYIVLDKTITFGLRVALAKIAQPFAGIIIILKDSAVQKLDTSENLDLKSKTVASSSNQNTKITENEEFGIEKAETSSNKDGNKQQNQNSQQDKDASVNKNNNKKRDESPPKDTKNNNDDGNGNEPKDSDSDNDLSEKK